MDIIVRKFNYREMASVKNWQNLCRLCSEEKTEMLSIFGREGIERKIVQKLRACLPVLVYKTDPLPKQICQFCAARLDDAYEFREYCLSVYKSMHAKLLLLKDSKAVHIFLDAMHNSPDPCQVQLCKEKCRAPPPLVPLPVVLPIESVKAPLNQTQTTNYSRDPLPELPCEVEIKEEASDAIPKNNNTQTETLEGLEILENLGLKRRNDCRKIDGVNGALNEKPTTSILEQVLKGNLTLNDHQESKGKSGLSSKWWCAPCNNYYRTKESLIKHMQVFCPRRYTCRKCLRVFYTVEDLAKHDGTDHLKITLDFEESVSKCHQCDREFVSWEMLRHHRLCDHVAENIEIGTNTWCSICNRFFPNVETYQNHKQLHQLDTMTKLPKTSFVPLSQSEDSDNTEMFNTRIEKRKDVSNELIKSEKKRENFNEASKSLMCTVCGKICTQQSALSNHMRTHEPKKYQCDMCGRWFGLQARLTTHKFTEHNQVMSLPTSIEQEEALNAEREAREAKEVHRRGKIRSYSEMITGNESSKDDRPRKRASLQSTVVEKNSIHCGICLQFFDDRAEMIAHLKTHNEPNMKSFSCSVCSKVFKERWQLTAHEIVHNCTEVKNYTCMICKEEFTDRTSLKEHQRKHIIDKTYHCSKCNKIFFKEFSLATHQCTGKPVFGKRNVISKNHQNNQLILNAVKKYMCSKCNATFSNSQSRNSHMRVHTKAHAVMLARKQEMKEGTEEEKTMPKLVPENCPSTSALRVDDNKKVVEMNSQLLVKRTLIKTAKGYRCGVCQSPFVLRDLAVAHLRSAHPRPLVQKT